MASPDLRAGGAGGGDLLIPHYKQRVPLKLIRSGSAGVTREPQVVVFQADGIPPENRNEAGDFITTPPAPTQA